MLGRRADGKHPGIEDGLLGSGDDPVEAAGAEHAARQALELGGHALLKCGALGGGRAAAAAQMTSNSAAVSSQFVHDGVLHFYHSSLAAF
jgi:hypothetical protein